MHDCPSCGQPTPEGEFCVRCGAPQAGEAAPARDRRQFAAAPGQRRNAPWLISTLFPQLPRHSERHFHLALGAGLTVVAVLAALRFLPAALILAALLMPLLAALYLRDVNVYETEPTWALVAAFAWGAAAGVAGGLISRAAAPDAGAVLDRGSTFHLLIGGVLIPVIGLLVALAGPLLLSRRRFRHLMDGIALVVATAGALAAGEAVMVGIGLLSGGLRPGGAALPWIWRLLAVAVATPGLTMAAAGSAAASLWLRYRVALGDPGAVGVPGAPAVAVPLALLLVAAGAAGETFLPAGAWLVWLLVLGAGALVLMRRALHVALLEEESEREIGPEIRCANCGHMTATHTFCGHCGIALRALPTPPEGMASGTFAGRLAAPVPARAHRRLLTFSGGALVTLAAGFAATALAESATRHAPCPPQAPCGRPPVLPVAPPSARYEHWRSSALGYSLRYLSSQWHVIGHSADGLTLQTADGSSELTLSGSPAAQALPAALASGHLDTLRGQLLGLTADTSPSDLVLGPAIGLQPAAAAEYTATAVSPQGPQSPVFVVELWAGDARTSLLATVIAPADNDDERKAAYQEADDVLNSVSWSGQ